MIAINIPVDLAQDVASAIESQADRYRNDTGHSEDGISVLRRDADRLDALADAIRGAAACHGGGS